MARTRVREEEHENHERWLVSYADFITLLFAFFVVMYAISTRNENKQKAIAEALMQAFRHDRVATVMPSSFSAPGAAAPNTPAEAPSPAPAVDPAVEASMRDLAKDIQNALRPLVDNGQVRLRSLPDGLAVEISASVLFDPGAAELAPTSITALSAVASLLKAMRQEVRVEGHTDNVKMASPAYPSNWELSSARAAAVVRLFEENGVAPAQLSAVGYADNRPVESNDTPEGRARNRRVTLMIVTGSHGETGVRPFTN